MAQFQRNCKGDWIIQVEQDFIDFKSEFSFDFLENISKNRFRELVNKRAESFLFSELKKQQSTHTKMQYLKYKSLKMQEYLLRGDISTKSKKTLFKWRVHMESFDGNF